MFEAKHGSHISKQAQGQPASAGVVFHEDRLRRWMVVSPPKVVPQEEGQ